MSSGRKKNGFFNRVICTTTTTKRLFLLLGSNHELGTNVGVKLLLAQGLQLHSTLLEGEALLVSVLGDLGGHVVTDDGVEASDKHQTRGKSVLDVA